MAVPARRVCFPQNKFRDYKTNRAYGTCLQYHQHMTIQQYVIGMSQYCKWPTRRPPKASGISKYELASIARKPGQVCLPNINYRLLIGTGKSPCIEAFTRLLAQKGPVANATSLFELYLPEERYCLSQNTLVVKLSLPPMACTAAV